VGAGASLVHAKLTWRRVVSRFSRGTLGRIGTSHSLALVLFGEWAA